MFQPCENMFKHIGTCSDYSNFLKMFSNISSTVKTSVNILLCLDTISIRATLDIHGLV